LPSADAFRDLDPSKRRRRAHDAVTQVFLSASLARPLGLIIEDLHWIDSETQAVLDLMAESIAGSRVLLLANCRPEYRHGWGSRSAYSQIMLGPLLADGVEELLAAVLGIDPSLGALKQSLIGRTEGNPFFLEECVRTLAETGVIVGESSAYRLGNAAGNWVLPMTVQSVIASRVARLSREEKLLLQSAAVIGKDVRETVLRSIAGVSGERFQAILASLRHAEFILETRAHPDPEYTFTRPLTHEVVYESLPAEQRRDLHAAIMEAIERRYADRQAEQIDRLAHHAFCGEAWPKALAYLRQAGIRAATRSAYREAVSCFEQALAAIAHLPDGRETIAQAIDVQLELQGPLGALGQKQRSRDYLRRAKELAVALQDRRRLGRVLAVECINSRAALEFDRALGAGEHALSIATDLAALDLEATARYGLGMTFYDLGGLPISSAWASSPGSAAAMPRRCPARSSRCS
jgi:predicted ATPase